jgi:hypothetical protein
MKPEITDQQFHLLTHPLTEKDDARKLINDLLSDAYHQGRVDRAMQSWNETVKRNNGSLRQ